MHATILYPCFRFLQWRNYVAEAAPAILLSEVQDDQQFFHDAVEVLPRAQAHGGVGEHSGSGAGVPVGSVMISPTHIYPGPVGVDIKCSMSLLQTDIPAEARAKLMMS